MPLCIQEMLCLVDVMPIWFNKQCYRKKRNDLLKRGIGLQALTHVMWRQLLYMVPQRFDGSEVVDQKCAVQHCHAAMERREGKLTKLHVVAAPSGLRSTDNVGHLVIETL